MWYKFIYNILHGSIITNIVQWMTLMNDNVTGWTSIVIFQMIDQTRFTNCNEKEMNISNANHSDHCHNDHDIILRHMDTVCTYRYEDTL